MKSRISVLVARGEAVEQVPKYLPQRDFDADSGDVHGPPRHARHEPEEEGTSQGRKETISSPDLERLNKRPRIRRSREGPFNPSQPTEICQLESNSGQF